MKVKISRSELIKHKGVLRVTRRTGKIISSSTITISASENLTIKGMGFSETLDCETESWGRVALPYSIWGKLIKTFASLLDDTVIITAGNGVIELNGMQFSHPSIQVTTLDNTFYPIPLGATHIDIIKYVFNNSPENFSAQKDWGIVLKILHSLFIQIDYAGKHMAEWGITSKDFAVMVADKLQIKNKEAFLDVLFSRDVTSFNN